MGEEVFIKEKLVFQGAVPFLILFVLMDAILFKLDLQKRETKRHSGIASLLGVRFYFKIRVRNLGKKP